MSGRATRDSRTAALVLLLAVLLLQSCSGRAPSDSVAKTPHEEALVVASFDFPESELLAEIYAQALEGAGIPVRRSFDLGPRELVLPALEQDLVDVVPEYVGSALQALRPGTAVPAGTSEAVESLAGALRPWGLSVLRPAPASDTNGLVVTAATARRLDLRTISDLRRVAPRLQVGGPPECPGRRYCLIGLQERYGLRFAGFSAFSSEAQRRTALTDGVVDVAVMFTTDGLLVTDELVLLEDDRRLQPPENVVPVVTQRALDRYGNRIRPALDQVSAALSTSSLTFVNWRVEVAGKSVPVEASAWLRRHVPALAR